MQMLQKQICKQKAHIQKQTEHMPKKKKDSLLTYLTWLLLYFIVNIILVYNALKECICIIWGANGITYRDGVIATI